MAQIIVYGIALAIFAAFAVSMMFTLIDWPAAACDVIECLTIGAALVGGLAATYFVLSGLSAALL